MDEISSQEAKQKIFKSLAPRKINPSADNLTFVACLPRKWGKKGKHDTSADTTAQLYWQSSALPIGEDLLSRGVAVRTVGGALGTGTGRENRDRAKVVDSSATSKVKATEKRDVGIVCIF